VEEEEAEAEEEGVRVRVRVLAVVRKEVGLSLFKDGSYL